MPKINVMIIDDHQMIREGLVSMLSSCEDIAIVGTCESGEKATQMVRTSGPDVILMDSEMVAINGISAAKELIAQRPQVKIIILTVFEDANFMCLALQAGVNGYIQKYVSSEKLIDSIKRVYLGEKIIDAALINIIINEYVKLSQLRPVDDPIEKTIHFTSREKEIFYYLTKGMTNKELSVATHSSVDTIKTHLRNIFRKLDVNNRCQAITQGAKYFNMS